MNSPRRAMTAENGYSPFELADCARATQRRIIAKSDASESRFVMALTSTDRHNRRTASEPGAVPVFHPADRKLDPDRMDDNDNRLFGATAQIARVPKPSYQLTVRTPLLRGQKLEKFA
jgi:hypothetical protein